MARLSGTEGYAAEAAALAVQYESIAFAQVHAAVLHLVPPPPCRVLDIGAGTGRDAAALAALGHRVLAVEPTDEMRMRARALHPSPAIEWLDDGLPDLATVKTRGEDYDLVMLSAVWMHLDEEQRRRAMPNVASLVSPGGVVFLSLRYGPVPHGRRMFAVPAEDTIELAAAAGLALVSRSSGQDSSLKASRRQLGQAGLRQAGRGGGLRATAATADPTVAAVLPLLHQHPAGLVMRVMADIVVLPFVVPRSGRRRTVLRSRCRRQAERRDRGDCGGKNKRFHLSSPCPTSGHAIAGHRRLPRQTRVFHATW